MEQQLKTLFAHTLLVFTIVLCGGCSRSDSQSSPVGAPAITNSKSDAEVTISITPRQSTFKLAEPVYIDVAAANRTSGTVTIPYIYDCTLEIDGSNYTQFSKPRLYDDDGKGIIGKTFPPQSEEPHGTLTLGGPFKTVDAETGKVPLRLTLGRHTLELICGAYRSDRAEFTVEE